MDIQRIKAPAYKIGRKHYNEYEVRQLIVDVAEGRISGNIKITDVGNGEVRILSECGRYLLDDEVHHPFTSFDLNTRLMMDLLKHKRKRD